MIYFTSYPNTQILLFERVVWNPFKTYIKLDNQTMLWSSKMMDLFHDIIINLNLSLIKY
jgi:hypothetical protein